MVKMPLLGKGIGGPVKASRIFGYFLAGWIRYAPEVMVFYAPTINSYKTLPGQFLGPYEVGLESG